MKISGCGDNCACDMLVKSLNFQLGAAKRDRLAWGEEFRSRTQRINHLEGSLRDILALAASAELTDGKVPTQDIYEILAKMGGEDG